MDSKSSHRWGDFRTKGIGLRASERIDDTLFQFVVGGSEVPYAELRADKDALLSYIIQEIGRPDLEFGEVTFVEDWRYGFIAQSPSDQPRQVTLQTQY